MYIIYTLLQNSNFSMENMYVLVAKHYTVNNCCSFYIIFFTEYYCLNILQDVAVIHNALWVK